MTFYPTFNADEQGADHEQICDLVIRIMGNVRGCTFGVGDEEPLSPKRNQAAISIASTPAKEAFQSTSRQNPLDIMTPSVASESLDSFARRTFTDSPSGHRLNFDVVGLGSVTTSARTQDAFSGTEGVPQSSAGDDAGVSTSNDRRISTAQQGDAGVSTSSAGPTLAPSVGDTGAGINIGSGVGQGRQQGAAASASSSALPGSALGTGTGGRGGVTRLGKVEDQQDRKRREDHQDPVHRKNPVDEANHLDEEKVEVLERAVEKKDPYHWFHWKR